MNLLFPLDASEPNVRVTKLVLLCDDTPEPVVMDLTGNPFLLLLSFLGVTVVAL